MARSGDRPQQELTPEQTIQRETANPLYLKLVAEELRLFGDYDRLTEFIAGLPTDVPGMFHAVLGRLEGDHGRALVEHALSLVATGRHGLLEGELLELLARPGEERFPMALWSRLYRGLAFYFKPRASIGGGGEGLIDFFHQQLAKAVRGRYLGETTGTGFHQGRLEETGTGSDQGRSVPVPVSSDAQLARHAELAGYFQRKGDPATDGTWKGRYPRSLSELVHHQIGGQLWDDLEKSLTTLPFLEANVTAGRSFNLTNAFSEAVAALPEPRPQRRILMLLEEALRRDVHFIARHAHDYPQGLFQCLWNSCWWYDCDDDAGHYEAGRPPCLPARVCGRGAGGEGSTSIADRPLLHPLLESWRSSRERRHLNFPWLRCHRPPPVHLGTAQLSVLRGHEQFVSSVSYSPDGRRIASGSDDHTVRVWDAHSGAELAAFRGHEDKVYCVAWSLDGRKIASGSDYGRVRVWDVRSGAELAVLCWHERSVYSLAFSPDGDRIASGAADGTVGIWDIRSGVCARIRRWVDGPQLAVLRGHNLDVLSVSYSSDGRRIASHSRDGTVRVWDTHRGSCLEVIQGDGDLPAIAAGPQAFPLRALRRGLETAVERADSGKAVAWFPVDLGNIITHPSHRSWAGTALNDICVISLEGGDTQGTGTQSHPLLATAEQKNRPWWKLW